VSGLYDIRLDAHVPRLPQGERDIEVSPAVFLTACVREVDLELVRAPLLCDASQTLQVGPEFPKESRMADVDGKGPQKPDIPRFAQRVTRS
jgi:hypothetical protein